LPEHINPLDHPICFAQPLRLDHTSAWVEHIPFGMFMVDILRPKVLVELGTDTGVSYSAFCQAVQQLGLHTRCYAVDTWAGDAQAGLYGPDIFANLRSHHNLLYGEFSRLVQSTFDEAVNFFADASVDLLHIDGLHTYEAVKHDFETWLPKLSQHAVVLVHDTNVRERDFGVWKLWAELQQKYPHLEFLHGHGLGVVYIGEKLFGPLEQLFSGSEDEKRQIREFFFFLGSRLSAEIKKENQIQDLSHQLAEKNRAARALSARIKEKEQVVQAPSAQISEKNLAFESLLPPLNPEESVGLIRSSELFDATWYLANNPDVSQAGMDPVLHYLQFGGFEGRDPSPNFSSKWYLDRHADVKKSGLNPLLHYLRYGKSEGRKTQPENLLQASHAPILVYTMGKVGTTTVAQSLLDAYKTIGAQVPFRHAHFLNEFDSVVQKALHEIPNPVQSLEEIARNKKVRDEIDQNPEQHWNIVSLVRDPVARNVATLFQGLSEFVPDWRQRYADGTLSVRELQNLLIGTSIINEIPDQWFDTQVKQIPSFGIDVYAEPFPKEIGYKIYLGASRARLLLIRLENLNECAERAMHEFLGLENFTLHNRNIGEEKEYADLYRAFKNQPLPVEYVQRIYNTRVARHFYAEAELLVFAKHWTGTDKLELARD
jgi:methyltransferase family protein/putative capsular polysaccharide synthesis protein